MAAWAEWRLEELNHPNLTEQYLMQVSYEVRCSQAKNPRAVKWEGFRLKFGRKVASPSGTTADKPVDRQAAILKGEQSKAAWLAGVQNAGGKHLGVRVKWVDRDGNPVEPPGQNSNGAPELP